MGLAFMRKRNAIPTSHLSLEAFGMKFPSRIGLGAGYDRNGEFVKAMEATGFGFIEIGTITPKPQKGDISPALHRFKNDRALLYCGQTQCDGVERVIENIKQYRGNIIVGCNIAKNDSTAEEDAPQDYLRLFRPLYQYADYFTVNIARNSSAKPYVPTDREQIMAILQPLFEFRRGQNQYRPILLKISPDLSDEQIDTLAKDSVSKLAKDKKYFRGLYCGGTFTEEALQYFSAHNTEVTLYSNLSNRYCVKLADSEVSEGHAILDLGAEDFTAKAPHPVFDPSLRLARLRKELEDPQVGVVLLDFITGPGVAYDPITAFARECAKHPDIIFISNICGSLEDPQNVEEKQRLLEKAGVIVTKSNYQSSRLASALMNALERR